MIGAEEVGVRLAEVRRRIIVAGGEVDAVRIVAVTKGFGPDAVAAAHAAGLVDLGENYAQEIVAKAPAAGGSMQWHLLGPVQRNKVRAIAGMVRLWQAIDRAAAGEAVAHHVPGAAVLVQVNISGEPQKSGCRPQEAEALVAHLVALGLDVRGLMAVGPAGPPEAARGGFRLVADMARGLGLGERSMGMTDDLEVAVQEGTSMVRVGRALFGPRPAPRQARR